MAREVVLCGASGGVGSYLAPLLAKAGWKVHGVSRSQPSFANELGDAYQHHSLDLLRPQSQRFGDLPLVISAAITRDGKQKWIAEGNAALTRNALALTTGPVVHISSSSVYDLRKPSVNVLESDATGNYPFLNSYSAGKWASEQLVCQSDRPAIILRPHAVYGPGDQTLVPRLRAAVRLGIIVLPLRNNPVHQFTSMANLAQAIELSLLKLAAGDVTSAVVLNVTDSTPTAVRDAVKRAVGADVRIATAPLEMFQAVALLAELVGRLNKSEPRLSRYSVAQLSQSRTYNLDAARAFLGYAPTPTDFSEALPTNLA